jgi:1-phosphatidylinositol-3-phosphate 5-kinase
VENKMASLDSLVLQEQEFLKNMVGRIVALKPSLVLVEKTVSRVAQDMLLAKGISVVLNIKQVRSIHHRSYCSYQKQQGG